MCILRVIDAGLWPQPAVRPHTKSDIQESEHTNGCSKPHELYNCPKTRRTVTELTECITITNNYVSMSNICILRVIDARLWPHTCCRATHKIRPHRNTASEHTNACSKPYSGLYDHVCYVRALPCQPHSFWQPQDAGSIRHCSNKLKGIILVQRPM